MDEYEHSYCDCIINIRTLYEGGKLKIAMDSSLKNYGEKLVMLFSHVPGSRQDEMLKLAKVELGGLEGIEKIIDSLEHKKRIKGEKNIRTPGEFRVIC